MSIYPVRLSEWFPIGDEYHDNASMMVECTRCLACGEYPRWKAAIGHHSIPWGNGDIWCSWKCCGSRKEHKLDKRQKRTWNRKSRLLMKDVLIYIDNVLTGAKDERM